MYKKIKYLPFILLFLASLLMLPNVNASCSASANTFSVAGSFNTVVPAGCNLATIQLWGGGGASGSSNTYGPDVGGGGGYITGNIAVTAGNTLYIYVGGKGTTPTGGTNGGGTAGTSEGGGGGCSAISTSGGIWNTASLNANILAVAAGGGGGYGSVSYAGTGGAGGGLTGAAGSYVPGGGGTQTSGGTSGGSGTAGTAFLGGSSSGGGGAGGGCGYYGGGYGGSGGGGSSWNSISAGWSSISNIGGSGLYAGGNTVSGYTANAGQGGASGSQNPGYNGLAIIKWNSNTINAGCAFSSTTTNIIFPSVAPLGNDATANQVTVTNGGTSPSNILVAGTSWSYASNTFGVSNTMWNPIALGSYAGNALTGSNVDTNIYINAGSSNSIYFGLAVPSAVPMGIWSQTITLTSSC